MKIVVFDFEVFKYDVLLGTIILDNSAEPQVFQTWNEEEIKDLSAKLSNTEDFMHIPAVKVVIKSIVLL